MDCPADHPQGKENMKDESNNERWKTLVSLTSEFLRQEHPADRDQRMKTAMAKTRGRAGNWRALLAMTHGIIALRQQVDVRGPDSADDVG